MKTEIKKRDGIPVQQVAYINDLKVTTAGSYVAANDTFGTAIGKLDTAIHNIPAQTDYAVTCAETIPSGYAKTYTFTQCGKTIATVNIPKDMVVSSGQIVDKSESGTWGPAGKYIELTLANADNTKVYIAVADLVDTYTAAQNASQVQLAISNSNEISATIVAGSVSTTELADGAVTTAKVAAKAITDAKLSDEVNADLALARTALQSHQDISGKADKSEMTVTPGTGTDADKTTIQLKSGTSATVLTAHQDISGKADASDLTAHTGNTDIHVTTADKTAWNGAVTTLGTHTADTTVHITAAERTAWDAKYDLPSGGIPSTDMAQAVQDSLTAADSALQASDLDNTTIEKDATAGVRVKAGSITETHLSSSVNASLDLADSAYQKPSTGIAKTDLASDVQTSLGKADSAVQDIKVKIGSGTAATIVSSNVATLEVAEGTTNGTIKVAGSDVAVHGLGSAAYTPTTDYATAAQGAKADTAVQPADLGNVAPASADNSTVEVSGTTLQVKDGGITTAKLATLTSFKLVDTANDGSAYVGQVYQITIDHGAIMVTPVAS